VKWCVLLVGQNGHPALALDGWDRHVYLADTKREAVKLFKGSLHAARGFKVHRWPFPVRA
jgi:hypothetical protein